MITEILALVFFAQSRSMHEIQRYIQVTKVFSTHLYHYIKLDIGLSLIVMVKANVIILNGNATNAYVL